MIWSAETVERSRWEPSHVPPFPPVDYVADAITCIREAIGQAVKKSREISGLLHPPVASRYIPLRVLKLDTEENILECLFEAGTDANPGILRHFYRTT